MLNNHTRGYTRLFHTNAAMHAYTSSRNAHIILTLQHTRHTSLPTHSRIYESLGRGWYVCKSLLVSFNCFLCFDMYSIPEPFSGCTYRQSVSCCKRGSQPLWHRRGLKRLQLFILQNCSPFITKRHDVRRGSVGTVFPTEPHMYIFMYTYTSRRAALASVACDAGHSHQRGSL